MKRSFALLALCGTCAAPRPAAPRTQPTAASLPPAQSAPAAAGPAPARPTTTTPSCFAPNVERMFDGPVDALALGVAPRVALRSGLAVSLFDGKTWKALPALPASLTGQHFELFFGRDNAPRVMGYADTNAGPRALYLRFKQGRWQPEPSELGPLANVNGALYGVLGYADPEVVCRPGEICLIKRVSGWTRVPAHAEPQRIVLSGNRVWALGKPVLQRLEGNGFTQFEPAPQVTEARAVWADSDGQPWLVDGAPQRVLRFQDGQWQTIEAPLKMPRAILGRSADDVWLAGDDGVAHFAGGRFECVTGLPGPLRLLMLVGSGLWLAGAAGAFRIAS